MAAPRSCYCFDHLTSYCAKLTNNELESRPWKPSFRLALLRPQHLLLKFTMSRLQQNLRYQAIRMLAAGVPQGRVARHFGVSQSIISRLSEHHRLTRMTRDWPWPGQPYVTTQALDMNPIKHVWAMLSRRLQTTVPAPNTNSQLYQALLEEWRALPRQQWLGQEL